MGQLKYEFQESKSRERTLQSKITELEQQLVKDKKTKKAKNKQNCTDKQLTKPNYSKEIKEIRGLLAKIHQPINELTRELKTENQILINTTNTK